MKKIKELYKKGLNDSQISEELNISRAKVLWFRRKHNLISNYKSEQRFSYEKIIYTDKILNVLYGTLLGDGWLNISTYTKGNTATGGFTHSESQKEYFYYKYEKLKEICNVIQYKISKPKFFKKEDRWITGKNQYSVNFKSSPVLQKIHKELYFNKKKRITKEFLKHYNEVSLAFHYMDDGNKIVKNKKVKYVLHTESFSTTSLLRFRKFLLEKWKINTSVFKSSGVLYIKTNSSDTFREIINPYVIDSMKYKLF